ncbi:MAG: YdcF family protein [Oscillospiraceae bacterium]|nr:YdcF family protein [Oscillospiraceae bacterium]
MNKSNTKDWPFKRRLSIMIMAAIFVVLVNGAALRLMLLRASHMRIIFSLVFGMSVILVTFLGLWVLGASGRFSRIAKVLRRCFIVCLVVGFAGFLVFLGLIVSGAHTEEADVDVLIVLGAGLRNDAPSSVLQTRLDAAIRYLETREGVPVIVSGGLGRGEAITEAEAMFRYLSARGIDESLIWKEGASTNTHENVFFSRDLMKERGMDVENVKVAIVSNEFHLFRAKLIAGNAGFDAVGVAAQTSSAMLRTLYFFREAFALASEILL